MFQPTPPDDEYVTAEKHTVTDGTVMGDEGRMIGNMRAEVHE